MAYDSLTLIFVWILFFSLLGSANGHVVAWHKGMYCLNGTSGSDDPSTNEAVNPLFQLTFSNWWMHHINNCDQFPPAPGDFLELPANGDFTVELAVNRAFTTLSFDGMNAGLFTGGSSDPTLGVTPPGEVPSCITEPNIHTQNETMAAGTAFAISYHSNLAEVTQENLVIFSVLYHTPWRRIATYSVPNLPACPPGGCICAWTWIPNGCGEPNMYMFPYRCKVTGLTGNASIATPTPAVWCEDDPTKCIVGAKQVMAWHQLDGNNIEVDGADLAGDPRSPAYNGKMGFNDGAQTDVFMSAGSATQTSIVPGPTPTMKPVKGEAAARLVNTLWVVLSSLIVLTTLHVAR